MFAGNSKDLDKRAEFVLRSHLQKAKPQSWRTKTGELVEDNSETHTIKFNGWCKVVDPENGNYTPIDTAVGHMTVKWGRGDDAVYTDYRAGNCSVGIIELHGFVDKRILPKNQQSVEAPPTKCKVYKLDVQIHKPTEHAERLAGRLSVDNNTFRSNARFFIRVKVSTEEFIQFQEKLAEIEEKALYGMYKEMQDSEFLVARCITPLEVLAEIIDPDFQFNQTAINPHNYMSEFADHFPDRTSKMHFRAYSGEELQGNKLSLRERVDPSAGSARRQRINIGQGYR